MHLLFVIKMVYLKEILKFKILEKLYFNIFISYINNTRKQNI
jgi:hypothetical protein